MRRFQFSKGVDKNKMFLINWNELDGRLDPHFYTPRFIDSIKKINYEHSDNVSNVVYFSTETWDNKILFKTTFPYIEINQIDLLTGQIKHINELAVKDAPSRAKMIVRYGDILVSTTRPNRGAISLMEKEGVFVASTGFAVIRKLKRKDVFLRYLFYWLRQKNFLQQMERRSSGGNYPAITLEELGKIKIPIPSKSMQNRVIEVMDSAYIAKHKKEEEAKKLLDSIDDYLLGELGIKFPKKKSNNIRNRIFIRQFSQISGKRFDPKAYSNETLALEEVIQKSKYKFTTLSELIISNVSGNWGYDVDIDIDDKSIYSKCLVIRSTEFDNFFNLNMDNSRVKYRLVLNSKLKKMNIRENDILLEKSGGGPDQPVGRVALLTKEILESHSAIGYSNFIQKIRINENIAFPIFLFYYLRTIQSIGITDAMQSQTSGIRNLLLNEYFQQKIPIPPLSKQKEIARHISKIREKAKKLQEQATDQLDKAKKQVEEMILTNKPTSKESK